MTTALRAYLVDDTLTPNSRLARVMKETGRVDVVGSTSMPAVALAEIPARAVDVLFLGLQASRLDGFEVLERLPANLRVVVVIGPDRKDARRALDRIGIPHVTKTATPTLLTQTLDALEASDSPPDPRRMIEVLKRVADERLARRVPEYADRIAVHGGRGRIRLFEVTAISHFAADHNRTIAMTTRKAGLVNRLLGELEARLDPRKFFRIDRRVIVNLDWVDSIEPGHPGLVVVLKGRPRVTLKVARERIRRLKERIIF